MTVGVLALQGAFGLHVDLLESLGVRAVEVRRADQLDSVDRLVLPGGESTTMSMLAERFDLLEPLRDFCRSGRPVFGTCAGAILLGSEILDGRDDQHCLGAVDISVRRNGFGRQVDSFEIDVDVDALADAGLGDAPFHAVCIRAPVIERVGDGVEVMARIDGSPALVRDGAIMVAIFHPELAGDRRLHELFVG
ncbi:MAG TPA: pyridoxal 5'-phosphate synthase glutaminase subunit PdxT [Microthrixaceae bacterium]|nr:pyridoxal 5'-phosphate synthase glutaminase subunit PdxT [Microthrixaceae bacterium]HMU78883.1 pyridoxal 5'-phosphate synthase glutaminase subunit PdxT [Microthrixaceae bacterium]HMX65820.1 pyridoxal 5'-phosphate synthase glutaminase subunit PdxT [Microthrixaceae bacterium]HMY86517.1 pyridoxal 5'-phosphate synthase glutaminase subunit PdxT [Microthrixaceae bacterium]HNA35723.1 pyridoxal 5'-phosphate synthase glutaminase subunit PdxT [Microthrixaceae bacterium]